MKKNKKVYLLPGRKGKLDGFIGTLLLNRGYDVYGCEIDGAFERFRISKQVEIIQNDLKDGFWNEESIVIGTSYGAYLFLHSIIDVERFPAKVLLFSPVLGKSRILPNRPIMSPPRAKKLLEYSKSNRLPLIDIEVHTGLNDEICDPKLAQEIFLGIKNSKLILVEGDSHQLDRDYIKDVLYKFLKDNQMNRELKELYESKWEKLIINAKGTDATYPLLIKVDDKYKNADIRVMIVGQETDGWCGVLEDAERDIDSIQETYLNYLYKNREKYRRPFWNRKNFRYFEEKISKMFSDKKVAFIWNNVSKIGKNSSGKPTIKIEELEKNYFDVFEEEFKILKPNIVIFTTGNRKIPLNHEIKKTIKEEPVSKVLLVSYPSTIAIRTYHPNARIKGGKKRFKEDVIDLVKEGKVF